MMSRREVVAAGVLGTWSTAGAVPAEAVQAQTAEAMAITSALSNMTRGLSNMASELNELNRLVTQAVIAPSMSIGLVGTVKSRVELYLKTSGKFPEFCDVGTSVFFEVYDWHVKHQQQIQITRMVDQRLMIQFMFTQLILRWENESNYIGTPFDK